MTNDAEQMNTNAKAAAEELSKQGTFSFLDRLENRGYAEDEVEIFLDERAGMLIQKLTTSLTEKAMSPEQRVLVEQQIEHAREKARESRYIIHLSGISSERYDELIDMSQAEYPLEYRETRNPLTAKLEREVIDNDDRELLFRTHLWAECITSIEDSAGNVDTNISPEFVSILLKLAPLVAQAKIALAIESLRMITGWMDNLQGDDFFPKS